MSTIYVYHKVKTIGKKKINVSSGWFLSFSFSHFSLASYVSATYDADPQ